MDGGSTDNIVAEEMVHKLGLRRERDILVLIGSVDCKMNMFWK